MAVEQSPFQVSGLAQLAKGAVLSLTLLFAGSGMAFAGPLDGLLLSQVESGEPETSEPSDRAGDEIDLRSPRFTCQNYEGQWTVMYSPKSQPDQVYPWAIPSALGGGWTPTRRCEEISRRLESYRPDGLLELQTAVENGYDTICVTTQDVSSCRIVLTVPPGQDPLVTRDRVFENLTLADSGESTQGVSAFTSGGTSSDILDTLEGILGTGSLSSPNRSRSQGINLRPFLDRSDRGTGTQLRSTPSPKLDPDRFR